jgi:hypothetical protein
MRDLLARIGTAWTVAGGAPRNAPPRRRKALMRDAPDVWAETQESDQSSAYGFARQSTSCLVLCCAILTSGGPGGRVE